MKKYCLKCYIKKDLSEFHKQTTGKFGCYSICKTCRKILSTGQREIKNQYWKKWYIQNKSTYITQKTKRELNKYKTDINFKLKKLLRTRLLDSLKGKTKTQRTLDLLGCSVSELKIHLESQFKPGMTWENHGEWEIDHIKPCSLFQLSNSEEQIKCFHYTNLQPLWKIENRQKSNHYA